MFRALVLLILAAVAVTVPLWWHSNAGPPRPAPDKCDVSAFERVSVAAEIEVGTSGRVHPRITSSLTIRIPTSNARMENLLHHDADPTRKMLISCLLHAGKNPNEERDADTRIDYDNEVIEVVDQVHVDVDDVGVYWAGTTQVQVEDDLWHLRVIPPPPLHTASWEVTISAPAGWLASPEPWQSVDAAPTRLHWSEFDPTFADNVVVTADLQPDAKSAIAQAGNTPVGHAVSWGVSALTALGVAWASLFLLRHKQFGSRADHVKFRTVWTLVVVMAIMGVRDLFTGVFWNAGFDWVAVYRLMNLGLALLLVSLAIAWWLSRGFAELAGLGMLLLWVATFYASWAELGFAFLMTFTLLAATGKAWEMTLWKKATAGQLPLWLLVTSAVGAAVLVVERYAIAVLNANNTEWLGGRAELKLVDVYRFYPWELLGEAKWLLLGLAVAALWKFAKGRQFTPMDNDALLTALVLLAVGVVLWEISVLGWSVPVWPVTLGLLWVAWIVLSKVKGLGRNLNLADLRTKASEWYASHDPNPGPTPVDVLLAAGPAGEPLGNMAKAVRLGGAAAGVCGAGLVVMGYVTNPVITLNHADSVLLRIVTDVVWETAKWLFALAATGLIWQHLPGSRGVLKVLPIIAVYAIGPGLMMAVNQLSGVRGWESPVAIATFALVLVFAGLRMDKVALDGVTLPDGNRLQRFFEAYALKNLSSKLTAVLTPSLAVLAIWSAITGGEVSPPSEPLPPQPVEQQDAKR
ncbi:DUF6185 family protein [Lentzea sp. NPDC005914]|uniref:DUF6185 family protein n=1 Tax=Lentzea sp. NPDC005914 TaxID=3154572 RepID=UPI0034111363